MKIQKAYPAKQHGIGMTKRKKGTHMFKPQAAKQEQVPDKFTLGNTYQRFVFLFQKPKYHCSAVIRMLKWQRQPDVNFKHVNFIF